MARELAPVDIDIAALSEVRFAEQGLLTEDGTDYTLMPLGLPIQDNKFASVLSVNAPTLQAETGVKKAFYRDLLDLLQ